MRFYIYDLVDPRDDRAFYVGKGQRDRVAAHEREAAAGRLSRKCARIREIWAAGCQVERRIVRRFEDEGAAYAFEAERIAEYGLENLTNVVCGGWGGRGSPIELWSAAFLKRASPVLARAFSYLAKSPRAMLGQYDIAPAIRAWIAGAIEARGFEAVAAAVLPHGIRLVDHGRA